MPTIRIDYDPRRQLAAVSPKEDCPTEAWSNVRRFFEERYPSLVENRHQAVTLPWWAFISLRESLRSVLGANGIADLDMTPQARDLLLAAQSRTTQFENAAELRSIKSVEDVERELANLGFVRHLLPYQARNVARLCNLPAAATFSVPGSGKTTEALAYYFLTRAPNDRLLVIAPKNAFVAWEDELPACVKSIGYGFERLTGGQSHIREILAGGPKAVIISYHQLPRVVDLLAEYLVNNDVYMMVDESHRMKRGTAGVHGSSILSLSHLPKRKLILSGTPVPNSADDLVAQFNFLYPERAAKPDQVVNRFRDIFVRTTKSELGLVPPYRLLQEVPMSSAQERLYVALASDTGRLLQGLSVQDRLQFRRIAKCVQYMIQAASNPSLLITSPLAYHDLLADVVREGISPKLAYACALARKWSNEGSKVVIWSTFVDTVEHLAGLLADVGAEFIHGGVETSEDPDAYDSREARIREFNAPDSGCRVLVANPAACSEGISLHHVCHRAIYIDRNYNAAQYLQSEDRIHRIGLPPGTETYVTILSSPGSIDESVNRRLLAKVSVMQAILDDPDLNVEPLDLDNEDDVEGLDVDDLEDLRQMLRVAF